MRYQDFFIHLCIMLKVKNLTYLHNASEGVKNINLEVQPGEFAQDIGESGCGKSTLLKSIFGLYGRFFGIKMKLKTKIQFNSRL